MFASMMCRLVTLRYDRKGVSSLEYGILAAAIIGAIAAATTVIGADLATIFNKIEGFMNTAAS